MPTKAKLNKVINGYKLVKFFTSGGMSWMWLAEKDGQTYFLKHYKSPVPESGKQSGGGGPWFDNYIKYEKDKNKRIQNSPAKRFCLSTVDIFTEPYPIRSRKVDLTNAFQVFEFIENGRDLKDHLGEMGDSPHWDTREIIAKVLMRAVSEIHKIDLVHGDLKPQNIFLIEVPGQRDKFNTRLIDMDGSVLTDIQAPWHNDPTQGYLGTDGYFSPEHLKGEVPQTKSDVFTCGIILYELLTGTNPYDGLDKEAHLALARKNNPPEPNLYGSLRVRGNDNATQNLKDALRASLSYKPESRPTAEELWNALVGIQVTPAAKIAPPRTSRPPRTGSASPPVSVPLAPKAPPKPPVVLPNLMLTTSEGSIKFKITTRVGRSQLSKLGEGSKYSNRRQFIVRRRDKNWYIEPLPDTTHQTLLNDKAVIKRSEISNGDVISIGDEAKNVSVFPMKVEID